MKKYMVIERFNPVAMRRYIAGTVKVAGFFHKSYFTLHSWVNRDSNICFQLMETKDRELFDVWIEHWKDLIDFEIYPIDVAPAPGFEI